jgi:hypothetical protein
MLLTLRGYFDLDASVYAGNRSECHNQFALIEKRGTRWSACLSSTGSEKRESINANAAHDAPKNRLPVHSFPYRARTGDPLLANLGYFNLSRRFGCVYQFKGLLRLLQRCSKTAMSEET